MGFFLLRKRSGPQFPGSHGRASAVEDSKFQRRGPASSAGKMVARTSLPPWAGTSDQAESRSFGCGRRGLTLYACVHGEAGPRPGPSPLLVAVRCHLEALPSRGSRSGGEAVGCRSALMEQHLFWKFEGAVVGVALIFACLVVIRQRQLDRKALEKVQKQIESI
ncbi:Protein JTB [Fukomys damarensis]|uniref:Protein JTB n=1 Tax=Fukomys damarensis TaxID=885580 RepID=A0A091E0X4_FUKDA|nr:Protein JTB [Fukomys damarensis]